MSRTATITTTNVATSKRYTPAGRIATRRNPAATGPSMPAKVPNPASSALDDGSSSLSRSRAGHVSNAGRLNV